MEYVEKLQNAINYMENNLKGNLKLDEISRQCHFSVPHFYRLFEIFTGYSVMEYVRKRRLSEAAQELLVTGRRIIDVSLDYRFESQEAFIRAFKKMFGVTPGEYRRTCSGIGLFSRLDINREGVSDKNIDARFNPQFIEEEFKLIGIEEKIDFSRDFVKTLISLQERLIRKLGGIACIASPEEYIAYWYYKWNEEEPGKEPEIYYYASVKANERYCNVVGLKEKTIPSSSYAVFDEIRRGEIGGAEGYAYRVWSPASGRELNGSIPGDFEVYEDIRDIGPNSRCRIYIPVK